MNKDIDRKWVRGTGDTARKLVQANVRLDSELDRGVNELKQKARMSKETVVDTLLRVGLGDPNPVVKLRKKVIDEVLGEIHLSFKRAGYRTSSQKEETLAAA